MGRYMRKAKISGEVAVVMDLTSHSTLGVRTRAKTLALQRLLLQNPGASSPQPESSSTTSYLQLRSRRLEKTPASKAREESSCKGSDGCESHVSRGGSGANSGYSNEDGVEMSFGENIPEVESVSRDVRETTPCNMILGSGVIGTPGSTTRPTNLNVTNRRIQHAAACRSIPSAQELEEFFAGAEVLQQRMFLEKYNYDAVNDCPLRGRFEWVRLDS